MLQSWQKPGEKNYSKITKSDLQSAKTLDIGIVHLNGNNGVAGLLTKMAFDFKNAKKKKKLIKEHVVVGVGAN